jgi:hypothetical protein
MHPTEAPAGMAGMAGMEWLEWKVLSLSRTMQRGDLTAVFPSKGSASAPAPNDHLAGISQSEELSRPVMPAGY